MAKKGRRATEEERIRAVELMESGKSPDVVAKILGVGRSSVFEWQKKYREGGLAALSTKFASGRPTVLSDQQMIRLRSMIVGVIHGSTVSVSRCGHGRLWLISSGRNLVSGCRYPPSAGF